MDYINWLLDRGDPQGGYELENVKKLQEEFGNPQDKIKIIHVAGTNGKGSVVNFVSKALINSDLKCGMFISPYIDSIYESMQINNKYIAEDDFLKYLKKVYQVCIKLDEEGYYTTTFEILITIAYLYFYDNNVDIALIEVGLGGRTDASNTMKKPLLTIITSISLDHTAILGDSIDKIAYQKGGIIKDGVDLCLYPQEKAARDVIFDIAKEKSAEIFSFEKDEVNIKKSDINGNVFDFRDYKDVKTSLIGKYQAYNASLAILALNRLKKHFDIDDETIKESIYETKNHARLELAAKNPQIVLDGSHNLEGIKTLVDGIKNFKYKKLILGYSILKDKDIKHILEKIIPLADAVVLTEINNPRKLDIDSLNEQVKKYNPNTYPIKDRKKAFEKTLELADKDDLILWCGSFYLLADISKFVKEYNENN
jgi:dihydrofolate synthase/folylpolyglutamate synthase